MSAPLYRKLGSLESPADCLAVVEQPALPKLGEEDAAIWRGGTLEPVLVLEEVQDPTNVGAMIRTADALGCRLVIGIGGAKPLSAKCVRASMGSAFALPIATAGSSGEALGYLRERSCANIAAAATGEACDEVTYDFPAALWIGNE
ncbi:MAG: RNA methyltransferase, partial [Clostridiaceae bacterium]|nr:RNA methyltransferase [Clostridiaceae bacterium]